MSATAEIVLQTVCCPIKQLEPFWQLQEHPGILHRPDATQMDHLEQRTYTRHTPEGGKQRAVAPEARIVYRKKNLDHLKSKFR